MATGENRLLNSMNANCTASDQTVEAPGYYSLSPHATRNNPRKLKQLKEWLARSKKTAHWDGKLYVASTIEWDQNENEFRQRGCSPNYLAGWWSLACCKHDMRSGAPFRVDVEDYAVPTYVFTFARKNPKRGFQALVSVARVTKHFSTMDDYARFLLGTRNRRLKQSRLTRLARSRDLGWRFGDCHANEAGKVGKPNPEHRHNGPHQWHRDNDGTHMVLVSKSFLLWKEPVFVARRTIKQSRFGHSVTESNLDELLKEV